LRYWLCSSLSAQLTGGEHQSRYTSSFIGSQYPLSHQNVNTKIVQHQLGHATISQAIDTYSPVMPHIGGVAVDALEAALSWLAGGVRKAPGAIDGILVFE
jgi:hypothetical protein